ncbi:PTS sugar transporter subunit IIA [Paraburkholderia dinghuensis]|uniref:PTS sugar transporter subunit IIA n=1 Tax=Paraburkholderia dinghuensis TaxID=2305225 RepID=A0A3N6N281_9BURK|nr:PTS sugar transporter subunit IIA [Paraburkholderia dinghuensis]RQH04651.1 PTS sugar transporter subunit IIA [Paraburkholderia dinghuensis]
MAGILIIAHAPLATALRECIAHIYGGCPARIGALDVLPDSDPVEVVQQANAEIERLREENGALVLTDMFGATPSNIAARLATLPQVRVLAGVNLPMLVRAVCYRATPLDMLVEKALTGAGKGVQLIGPAVPPPQNECGCAPAPCGEAVTSKTNPTGA